MFAPLVSSTAITVSSSYRVSILICFAAMLHARQSLFIFSTEHFGDRIQIQRGPLFFRLKQICHCTQPTVGRRQFPWGLNRLALHGCIPCFGELLHGLGLSQKCSYFLF